MKTIPALATALCLTSALAYGAATVNTQGNDNTFTGVNTFTQPIVGSVTGSALTAGTASYATTASHADTATTATDTAAVHLSGVQTVTGFKNFSGGIGAADIIAKGPWVDVRNPAFAGGAKGDGATDDTAAFQTALNYLASIGGGRLTGPALVYKIAGALSLATTKNITIDFEPGAVIDGKTSSAPILVNIGGSLGASTTISDAAAQYASTVTVSSGAAFAAGDVVLLTTAPYCNTNPGDTSQLWNPARTYYYKGEFAEVQSVSGNTLTLKAALSDSYSGSGVTTVYKMNMPRVSISNLKILRNSNDQALQVSYSRDVDIHNVDISGARRSSFALWYCYGGNLTNNYATDAYYTGTGTSYGLEIDSSQSIKVSGGRYVGGRHGITTGGETPVRYLTISGVYIGQYTGPNITEPLNFHGNTEHVVVSDSTIIGDKGVGGAPINITLANNTIVANTGWGIGFYEEVGKNGYIDIRGGSINAPNYSGIEIRANANNLSFSSINVEVPTINSLRDGLQIGPQSSSSGGTGTGLSIGTVRVANSRITSATYPSLQLGAYSANTAVHIGKVVIEDGYYYTQSGSTTGAVIQCDNTSDISISGATFKTDVTTNAYALSILNGRNVTVRDSNLIGSPVSPYSQSNQISAAGVVTFENNRVENFSRYGGLLASVAPAPTQLIYNNNQLVNVAETLTTGGGTTVSKYLSLNGLSLPALDASALYNLPSSTTTVLGASSGEIPFASAGAYGAEKATPGSYAAWAWQAGWAAGAGDTIAVATGSPTGYGAYYDSASPTQGQSYLVTWTINSMSSGGLQVYVAGAYGPPHTAPGTYQDVIVAGSAFGRIGVYTTATTTASVGYFSMKQITTASGLLVTDPSFAWNPSTKKLSVPLAGGSSNKATCWKSDGKTIGYCSTQPDSTGACTCN